MSTRDTNQHEHVLEGTDCWCNPDVETYGDVPPNPPHSPPPPAPTDEDMEGRW